MTVSGSISIRNLVPIPFHGRARDGGLGDRRRHGDGGRGLHRGLGHADLRARRDGDDGDGNLGAAQGDASRVRLLVEASRWFETGGGALTPSLEIGLRHDGGDAETGTGVEVGGSVQYQGRGWSIEGSVRTLVAHEESGYEQWGASGAVRIDPGASGRGLSLTVAPSWGTGTGTGALWSARDASALTPEYEVEGQQRIDAELGYGLGLARLPGTVTPFAALSHADHSRTPIVGSSSRARGADHSLNRSLPMRAAWIHKLVS